jgi:hypothetical protein
MELLPISLPFFDDSQASARVHVIPHKLYNEIPGIELFKTYGVTVREPPKSKIISSFNITETQFYEVEELLTTQVSFTVALTKGFPDSIRLSGKDYDVKAICRIIETIQGIKLISIRTSRPIRSALNTSIEVKGFITKENLIIPGRRGKVYLLEAL